MTERDVIDGWKNISTYIRKSVKTVQRWERESDFPVHRVPGRQSVYALKEEVDEWLEWQTKTEKASTSETRGIRAQWDWMYRPRRISPALLILIAIVLGAISIRNMSVKEDSTTVLGPLTVKIVPYSKGSLLTVKNGLGNVSLQHKWNYNWCDAMLTHGLCMWRVVDVNRDGLDDFLLANPEKSLPMIDVYFQDPNGGLTLVHCKI